MMKNYLLLIIALFSTFSLLAQDKESTPKRNYYPATVYFKDGSTKMGYLNMYSDNYSKYVKFMSSTDSEVEKLEVEKVDSVISENLSYYYINRYRSKQKNKFPDDKNLMVLKVDLPGLKMYKTTTLVNDSKANLVFYSYDYYLSNEKDINAIYLYTISAPIEDFKISSNRQVLIKYLQKNIATEFSDSCLEFANSFGNSFTSEKKDLLSVIIDSYKKTCLKQ